MPQREGPVGWYHHYLPRIDSESTKFYTGDSCRPISLKNITPVELQVEKMLLFILYDAKQEREQR